MTHNTPQRLTFESIEQIDGMVHKLGWPTEYRQLEAGALSSSFKLLEDASWFLMDEQSDRTVEVQSLAPKGLYVIALFEGPPGAVNAQAIASDRVFIQTPDSEFRATLTRGMRVVQLAVAADEFEEMTLALCPGLSASLTGANTYAAAPQLLASLREAMSRALHNPAPRKAIQDEWVSETAMASLNAIIDRRNPDSSARLHRQGAYRALARAQDYIESHIEETMRIASISEYARTTPRTLERIFLREFGVSPQHYIKARRLHAVHRRLLSADRQERTKIYDIAVSYGFAHMGRFSEDYKRFFGRSPSQTLHAE